MANTQGLAHCDFCDEDTVDTSDSEDFHTDEAGLYHSECFDAYSTLAAQTWGACNEWKPERFRQAIRALVEA
jgi:hypothetical protein